MYPWGNSVGGTEVLKIITLLKYSLMNTFSEHKFVYFIFSGIHIFIVLLESFINHQNIFFFSVVFNSRAIRCRAKKKKNIRWWIAKENSSECSSDADDDLCILVNRQSKAGECDPQQAEF